VSPTSLVMSSLTRRRELMTVEGTLQGKEGKRQRQCAEHRILRIGNPQEECVILCFLVSPVTPVTSVVQAFNRREQGSERDYFVFDAA
jgi:hypothetical protein